MEVEGSSRKEDQKGLPEEVAQVRNLKDKEPALQRSGAKILPCGSRCGPSRVSGGRKRGWRNRQWPGHVSCGKRVGSQLNSNNNKKIF